MTDLLEKAVAAVRVLTPDMQDEIARIVLALADDQSDVHQLTPDEMAEQDLADSEEARDDYATDAEIRAIWSKHVSTFGECHPGRAQRDPGSRNTI